MWERRACKTLIVTLSNIIHFDSNFHYAANSVAFLLDQHPQAEIMDIARWVLEEAGTKCPRLKIALRALLKSDPQLVFSNFSRSINYTKALAVITLLRDFLHGMVNRDRNGVSHSKNHP